MVKEVDRMIEQRTFEHPLSPMLAAKAEGAIHLPVLASPKIDGMRALVYGGVLLTRNMTPVPNVHAQRLFGDSRFEGFDGELVVGSPTSPSCFRDTQSGMKRTHGEPDVQFHVFDDFAFDDQFINRQRRVYARVKRRNHRAMHAVPHVWIEEQAALVKYEQECLAQGYEGVMLRHPMGPYKRGRSTVGEGWLLKIKRFEDAEAVIVGVEELKHNDNEATRDELGRTKRTTVAAGMRAGGVLGAITVRPLTGDGPDFNIGSGFNAEQRAKLWVKRSLLLGMTVKYRFFPGGSKERPRFPVFVGFRHEFDMDAKK